MKPRHLRAVRSVTIAALIRAPGASPVTWCVRRLAPTALMAVAILIWTASSLAADIGTAFSYQGSLEKPAGTPVTDTCDFRFGLWDALTAGNQIGTSPETETAVEVVGGVFRTTIDFGIGAFDGNARWLEIEVQCPGDAAFVLLDPRQELTPAPYSIRAGEGVGGPNALNVTPSGDVGIGTTTPAARLDVNGAARTTTLEITGGSLLDGTLLGWGDNTYGQTNVPAGTFTAVAAGGEHSLAIRSNGTLVGWGKNTEGQTDVPSVTFTAVVARYNHSLAIGSVPDPQDPALRLLVDSAFKPGTNTWTIFSDRRLKKNIEPLSGALERLLQLHGVTFQWSDPASQGGITGTQMGLIADEVSRAFPQWVGRDPKGYQTLTVGGFEALTAEALRELRAEKDRQLKDKDCEIEELREMLKRASERIDALEGER